MRKITRRHSSVNTNVHQSSRNYPFVEELVDTLYKDDINELIEKRTETEGDKSIMMMFILMYFAMYLKLNTPKETHAVPGALVHNVHTEKKEFMKQLMTEFIRDPQKRAACLQMFHNQFAQLFPSTEGTNRLK